MTRKMDVIRKIILSVEEAEEITRSIDGISDDDFKYHAMLLKEAGLVKGAIAMSNGLGNNNIPASAIIRDLTWEGHDFASAIKNDDIWETVKNKISTVGSWTFSVLLKCLEDEAKRRFGLAMGS